MNWEDRAYEERERACIKHFDGGIPWPEAIEQAAEEQRREMAWLFDEEPVK